MPDNRLPKQDLNWAPQARRRGRRTRNRNKKREGIDKDMEERELSENRWTDREYWASEDVVEIWSKKHYNMEQHSCRSFQDIPYFPHLYSCKLCSIAVADS